MQVTCYFVRLMPEPADGVARLARVSASWDYRVNRPGRPAERALPSGMGSCELGWDVVAPGLIRASANA